MVSQSFIAEYKLNMQNQQVDLMTVVVAVVVVVVVVVVVDGMVVMTEEVEGMMTGAEGKLKYSFLLSKNVERVIHNHLHHFKHYSEESHQ